jgi:hypothetical protein
LSNVQNSQFLLVDEQTRFYYPISVIKGTSQSSIGAGGMITGLYMEIRPALQVQSLVGFLCSRKQEGAGEPKSKPTASKPDSIRPLDAILIQSPVTLLMVIHANLWVKAAS